MTVEITAAAEPASIEFDTQAHIRQEVRLEARTNCPGYQGSNFVVMIAITHGPALYTVEPSMFVIPWKVTVGSGGTALEAHVTANVWINRTTHGATVAVDDHNRWAVFTGGQCIRQLPLVLPTFRLADGNVTLRSTPIPVADAVDSPAPAPPVALLAGLLLVGAARRRVRT
jgi:hypothetical protein